MNSEINSAAFSANGHPDENRILLALEHELPADEASQVEQHLGNCWSCRARSEEMQRGILAFVEYREKRYLPTLETPPDHFSGFAGRLRSVIGVQRPSGLPGKVWKWLTALFAFPGQLRWTSAVAAVMVGVIFWAEVLNPPAISANELLIRAIASQEQPLTNDKGGFLRASHRVVHQKVEIRSGSRTVVRDFEWTLGAPIPQAPWSLQSNLMEWNAPLTAAGFSRWRDSLHERRDAVKRSGDLLRLDTTAAHSLVREAWMLVRAKDFHPVKQHIQFADERQFDLTEIAFEISEQSPPAVQAAPVEGPVGRSVLQPKTFQPKTEPVPSQSDLDEAELQLRYTLFNHQWDLGEDLVIARVPGRVTLSGTVSSKERESTITATLSTLPSVQLMLNVPNARNRVPSAGTHRDAAQAGAIPLLSDTLEKTFASRQERVAFIDHCLADSDTELEHAWALKRLAERYNEAQEHALKPESDRKLHEMIRAHLEKLSRANAGLQPLLDLLPASVTRMVTPSPNWRANILSLFTQVQQQDELVASLLVGTGTGERDEAPASAKYRSTYGSINALLGGLNEVFF